MRPFALVAFVLLLVATADGIDTVRKKTAPIVQGSGAYKAGDAYTKEASVPEILVRFGSCARRDESKDGLTFKEQCTPLSKYKFPEELPDLLGPDTVWNWACFASLVSTCDADDKSTTGVGAMEGMSATYFTNFLGTVAFTTNEAAAVAEMHLWTENQVRTDMKGLLTALTAASKQQVITIIHKALIAAYIQNSGTVNGFLWTPSPLQYTLEDMKKAWMVMALESALRAHTAATQVAYRGRQRRTNATEQAAMFAVGNHVWEKAFSSATTNEDVAWGYSPIDVPAEILRITPLNANSRGAVLGSATGENLYAPATILQVTAFTCHQNYQHTFETNSFGGVGQNAGNLCANGVCTANWTDVCIIDLQEVDTIGPQCPNGDEYVKSCVSPMTRNGKADPGNNKLKKLQQWVTKKLFGADTLGQCFYEGASVKAKAQKNTNNTCQRAALCRDANGAVKPNSVIVADGFCNPLSSASGLYF